MKFFIEIVTPITTLLLALAAYRDNYLKDLKVASANKKNMDLNKFRKLKLDKLKDEYVTLLLTTHRCRTKKEYYEMRLMSEVLNEHKIKKNGP